MFKSIDSLKETLKNKAVELSQDNDQLIIVNKQTNQAIFTMKLFNHGKTVNINQKDMTILNALPASTDRIITLNQLTHKIFRINYCQGKNVILMSTDNNTVKIENTLNNTSYELSIVNGSVTMPEADYKAIRNPKVVENGVPVPLSEIIKRNQPNHGQKRVKKTVEVEKSRFITMEALTNKIARINAQNDAELITLTSRLYKGKTVVTLTNTIVEDVVKLHVVKLDDEVEGLEIPIASYKKIRNPQHFDQDGNPMTLAQYLKSKPKKERVKKERVKKERVPKVKKEKPVTPPKPIEYVTMEVPKNAIVKMSLGSLAGKIARINRIEKLEAYKLQVDKKAGIVTINSVYSTTQAHAIYDNHLYMTKTDADAIKLPVHRDENGKRIPVSQRYTPTPRIKK